MAQKRMFDKDVIGIDSFLDLPMEAKALYFLLGMEADDEGFINPKKVVRLYGGTEDSIKILILKGFLIPFKSGVVVITDWKRNNYLDKTRVKETIYQNEKSQLEYNKMTQKYQCLTDVKQMLKENSIEENSIEKNSIEENSVKYIVEDNDVFKEIIDYLNLKTNQHFKTTTDKTRRLIKARLNENFTIDDFKVVIDKMCDEWLNTDMQKYLRPETLFGTKFEGYLNRQINSKIDEQMAILKGVYDGEIKIN